MRFLLHLSITAKIVLFSALLALLFLGSSYGYILYVSSQSLYSNELDQGLDFVSTARIRFDSQIKQVEDNARSISNTPPIQGIFRSLENEGFDERDSSTFEQWQDRLEDIFVAFIHEHPQYAQMRFIDFDGYELVRVDSENGVPIVIPNDQFQNKGDRGYILRSQFLLKDQVYVSRAELNREGSPPEVVEPYVPVIRLVVPAYDDSTNNLGGFIVINDLFTQ